MTPLAWRAPELQIKLALHPYSWFSPLIEECRPPFCRQFMSHPGYYFGLGIWSSIDHSSGSSVVVNRGYIAELEPYANGYRVAMHGYAGEFRECEFPVETFYELQTQLADISIPLSTSRTAIDGYAGSIRVSHCDSYIEFCWGSIEQPEWEPLLRFICKARQQFIPDLSFPDIPSIWSHKLITPRSRHSINLPEQTP